jgi:hypothetical protein
MKKNYANSGFEICLAVYIHGFFQFVLQIFHEISVESKEIMGT